MTARVDEDTGEPAPARSLPHIADVPQSARQAPPHQPLCFALQVWDLSFRQCLGIKAAHSVAFDDVARAESGALRRGALLAPASAVACSGRLWWRDKGPIVSVDGEGLQPAAVCVCSRVLLRCRLRAA